MAFAQLLNALARTSRETLMLQKYREACAQARIEILSIGPTVLAHGSTKPVASTEERLL